MLRLQDISLFQFKNYRQQNFSFTANVVGICGNNGFGKTNLLDAIYFICFSKSYFSRMDAASVHQGLQGMRIEGQFLKNNNDDKIVCILRENNKKELQRNGDDCKKFSEHIGQFPAVMIAPDDVELIIGNSDVRRRFMDTLLSQLDNAYLRSLIEYNKVLQQRNSFLKASVERGYVDDALLDILNDQLVKPGTYIFNSRKQFFAAFLPQVVKCYGEISGLNEPLSLSYYSPLLEGDFLSMLATYKQKDLLLQRSTIGIHKDDIEFTLHNENFKTIASQGQRKSLLFALKLAEFEELKSSKGFAPLLLLDDVFEKLDAQRMQNLLLRVCVQNQGQVFITDTHKDRLAKALDELQVGYQLIELT